MRSLRQAASALLLVIFPCAMMAGETGPIVLPSGALTVNGERIVLPTAVFAGDQIQTTNSSASLILAGGNVQVSPNSSMVYAPGTVTLDQGAMRVVTDSAVTGRVMNLAVHSASKGTVKYEMHRTDSQVSVAALEGNLAITDGHDQVIVGAGHALVMPVQGSQTGNTPTCKTGDTKCEQAMKKCKKDDTACQQRAANGAAVGVGAAGAAGAAAGGAAAGLSSAAIIGITAAVAAAAAGASLGAGAALGSAPASPVQ